MKKFSVILGITLTLLACVSTQAGLVITEVMSSSIHSGGTNNGDWFELTNNGVTAFDLTGFSWDDDSNTPGVASFGGITSIGAGQSIIFTDETVGAESSWIANWGLSGVTVVNLGSGSPGLGNGGDAIYIYNGSGVLVTSVTFGASTAGSSFEWDINGNSLGLSVLGENGAFRALSNGQTTGNGPGLDIGSPGVAVPEPSTYAMLIAGAGVMFWTMRRKRIQA